MTITECPIKPLPSSFSYFLSTLFSTSRVAGSATQFAYALAMLPGFIIPSASPYGGPGWWWACLLPPSAASIFAGAMASALNARGIYLRSFLLTSYISPTC